MKFFRILLVALVAMCGLNSCSDDCDHDLMNVDYSKSILGTWIYDSETYEEGIGIYEDGKFSALGSKDNAMFYVNGTWSLNKNQLVLTTTDGMTHFSGTVEIYPEDVMLMTADGSKDTYVFHYKVNNPFPKSLVGTWTCVEAGFAEALTIREDGSMVTTRLEGDTYIEGMEGIFMEEEGSYIIELNDEYYFGTYEVVSGELLALTDKDTNTRRTYRYCKEDLSEEVVGMWVYNDAPGEMRIHSFDDNGSAQFTGWSDALGEFSVLEDSKYKVVGDLIFQGFSNDEDSSSHYIAARLIYAPNGTAYGDIMSFKNYLFEGVESVQSWLRIKQYLELPGQKYDYIKTFVSNVKGADKDVEFMGHTFNFAKMDGVMLDKMLKTLLFSVEFPDANTIKYSCHYSSTAEPAVVEAPIAVDGNKMTIQISEVYPGFKDVDLYTFQDQDNTQMHMYMPTYSFVDFFGNMQVVMMSQLGKLDPTDAAAVKAIYDSIDAAVESINLSLVMTKAARE